MFSTCILIGQQMCFQNAMKHENDVSNSFCCLQVVRIYSFIKELKFTYALRVSTFSLLRPPFKANVRILEQVKILDCVSGFHWPAVGHDVESML